MLNQKQYWKIINSKPKETEPMAPLHDLYTYFKNINENISNINTDHEDFININNNIVENDLNIDINNPITEQEVNKDIQNLKNNKSPGVDNIVNEQIRPQ